MDKMTQRLVNMLLEIYENGGQLRLSTPSLNYNLVLDLADLSELANYCESIAEATRQLQDSL